MFFTTCCVIVEPLVFSRDEGPLDMKRNLVNGYPKPPMIGFVDFGEACPLHIKDIADARKLHPLEMAVIGQFGQCLVVEIDDSRDIHGFLVNRLVPTKLPVSSR